MKTIKTLLVMVNERTFVLMGIFVFYLQGRPGPKGDPGDSGLPGQKVSAGLAQAGKEDYSLGLPR